MKQDTSNDLVRGLRGHRADYVYPTVVHTTQEEYANEVEVEQGTHDAVLRFYRRRGQSRSLVREVTIPLGLLEWLQAESQ